MFWSSAHTGKLELPTRNKSFPHYNISTEIEGLEAKTHNFNPYFKSCISMLPYIQLRIFLGEETIFNVTMDDWLKFEILFMFFNGVDDLAISFSFSILYYYRKIEYMAWYGHNDLKLYDNKCILKWVVYVIKYFAMLHHDLISNLLDVIVYIFNQNALFIQRETQSYFPGSNLLYIPPPILKQSLDNKSIADLFALNHKNLCLQALNIPSVQNTL